MEFEQVRKLGREQKRLLKATVKKGQRPWAPKHVPTPKLGNLSQALPKILFLHLGYDAARDEREERYFNSETINRKGELIWFTQHPFEACFYGYRIGSRISGKSLLVFFPFESSNMNLWAEDLTPHLGIPGARVFVTNQEIRRDDIILATYSVLVNKGKNILADQYRSEIQLPSGEIHRKPPELPPELQTKSYVSERFGLTSCVYLAHPRGVVD